MKSSSLPMEALLYKLNYGFNRNLEAVATATYGIKPYKIAFPSTVYSPNTPSFIFGQIHPDNINKFGASNVTKMTMFAIQLANQNYEKPRDVSGTVSVGLDVHLEWLSSDMKQNLEVMSMATEDAILESIQLVSEQNWGPSVVYNGAFSSTRSTVAVPDQGSGSLRQLLAMRFGFQIDV